MQLPIKYKSNLVKHIKRPTGAQKEGGNGIMEVFNNLSYVAKCDILRKHSHYIGSAIYYQYVIKLYSWDRFFIEQYYDTEEKIFTRITIATDRDMEKYLGSIELELI